MMEGSKVSAYKLMKNNYYLRKQLKIDSYHESDS